MNLQGLWHFLRSCAGAESHWEAPPDENDKEVETAPEATEEPASRRHAIQEGPRDKWPPPAWPARPRSESLDLQQQVEKAAGEVLSSVGIRARVLDRDHLLKMALRLNDVAVTKKEQGNYDLAEALCERAMDIFEKTVVPDHPGLVGILENYAGILRATSRSETAALLEERAAKIRAKQSDERIFDPHSAERDTRIQ